MAVWQFKMWAVPAERFRTGNVDVIRASREQVDTLQFSLTPSEMTILSERLSEILPEKVAWHADLRIWGDEESDDVQIWTDRDAIEPVQMRLDVRHLSLKLIAALCDVARDFGWFLATPRGSGLVVLRPRPAAVLEAIMESPAQGFVEDPEGFLAKIDPSEDQPG